MFFKISPNRMRASLGALVAFALNPFILVPAYGQVSGAMLSGTVTDTSGAVIPKANVSIKNTATGVTRDTVTDAAGFYSVPNLLPGNYDITTTAPGFSTKVQTGIPMTVGAEQTQNIRLQLGQVTEKVEVTGEAPAVQLTTSAVSAQVDETTLRELPLNGRDWTQLATLQPGVLGVRAQATNNAASNRGNRGFGNMLTTNGHRPYENSYRMNGINVNDYSNGAPGSVLGVNLGVDAIQEFSVLTTDYPAEYGRTSGAVVNAIMKSGTNQYHGSAYWFLRDEGLDARNFFDAHQIPPFHRNQFGASGGGPIRKDRTFIFGDYEGIRQNLSQTLVGRVPSDAARNGILCSVPFNGCTPTPIPGGVNPLVIPYLGLWPHQNGGTIGNGDVGIYNTSGITQSTENFFTTRADHHISEKDNLAGSYLFDTAPQTVPDTLNTALYEVFTRRQMASLEETHIFGPNLVNSVRIGYNRSIGFLNFPLKALNPVAGDLSLGYAPGLYAPSIAVPGILDMAGGLGSSGGNFFTHHLNSWQAYDDAFHTRGAHSLKFGFTFERMQENNSAKSVAAAYVYSSVADALTNAPPLSVSVDTHGRVAHGTSEPRDSLFGGYLQDDWRARSNLTFNLGLRYEMMTLPTEHHNAYLIATDFYNGVPVSVNHPFASNPTTRNFEPRVGFAWDPFHNEKTAVRGGFGIFDVLPLPFFYDFEQSQRYPFLETLSQAGGLPAGSYPFVGIHQLLSTSVLSLANVGGAYVQQDPHRSYAMNWNLNIQREITSTLGASIGYVASRSVHQPFSLDGANMVPPSTSNSAGLFWPLPVGSGTRLNPKIGDLSALFWDGVAHYEGLQAELRKRMSHGLEAQASYTWGQCLDTGSSGHISDAFLNSSPSFIWMYKAYRRGQCDFNIAQNFSLNYLWQIPAPRFGSSAVSWIVGGWEVGGVLTASTGVPFTLQMGGDPLGQQVDTIDWPDRLPGCNPINRNFKNDPSGLPLYINAKCFAPPTAPASMASLCSPVASFTAPAGFVPCLNRAGNAGRNRLNGPGLMDFDFSLFKDTHIPRVSETFDIQFRAEFFNILNRANFQAPTSNNVVFDQTGAPTGGAGQLDSTTTTSRQIQFGMKIVW